MSRIRIPSLLFTLALAFGALSPARADIHFRGVLQCDGKTFVSLYDSNPPRPAEWVRIGATFRAYTVESYDQKRESVTLRKRDVVLEARLASSPAPIPPRRSAASKAIEHDGQRLCALHRVGLLEMKGYVAPPEVICQRAADYIMLAFMNHRAEFPNPFGWSVSMSPSEGRDVEILNEYCPRCETAFRARVAELKAENEARRLLRTAGSSEP
ncbi:MAG: hypothetical protein V4773_18760 [Verrucomicrobiota bacterium]